MATRAAAPVTVAAPAPEPRPPDAPAVHDGASLVAGPLVAARLGAHAARPPMPLAIRGALLGLALAALVLTVVGVALRATATDPLARVGLAAGSWAEPECGPLEEDPDSGIVACAHADEKPAGLPDGEPTLDDLVARAGGAEAVAAFADGAIDLAAGPTDIGDPSRIAPGGGWTESDTAATREDGSRSVYSTVPSGGTPGIACVGDGKSGNRVQALYVYPANRADRSKTVIPLIRRWAADVDRVVRLSAAQKASRRHLRWVHTSGCVLSVGRVQLSRYATGSFSRTISELAAKGYKRTDRRYLIWFDVGAGAPSAYCGIGRFYPDDRAGRTNKNNGYPYGPSSYARTDPICWGALTTSGVSVEAHELMHTIGAVQSSAPRSTRAGHCYDEYDTMCYADGGPRSTMRYVCAKAQEAYLDCGKNDYFNPRPASGSYLALRWNTARSSFMSAQAVGDPLVETATRGASSGAPTAPNVSVALTWKGVFDAAQARTRIEVAKDGGAYAALKTVAGTATSTSVTLARGSQYSLRLRVEDTGGRWSAWWVFPTFSIAPQDLPPTVSAPVASLSYRDGSGLYISVAWDVTDDHDWAPVSVLQEEVNSSGVWTTIGTFDYPGTELLRSPNTTYRYRVQARDSLNQWSAWVTGPPFTVADAPPTVSGPTAVAVDRSGATAWFEVAWSQADDDGIVTAEVATSTNGTTWTTVTDAYSGIWIALATDTSYTVRVRVRDTSGQWSAWATVPGTVRYEDLPPQVTTFTQTAWDEGSGTMTIELGWSATDDDWDQIVEVQIAERSTSSGEGTLLTGVQPYGYHSRTGRTVGTPWQYRLRVRDTAGQWSAWTSWSPAISSP